MELTIRDAKSEAMLPPASPVENSAAHHHPPQSSLEEPRSRKRDRSQSQHGFDISNPPKRRTLDSCNVEDIAASNLSRYLLSRLQSASPSFEFKTSVRQALWPRSVKGLLLELKSAALQTGFGIVPYGFRVWHTYSPLPSLHHLRSRPGRRQL